MKGKKFDAHEKHFKEKEAKLVHDNSRILKEKEALHAAYCKVAAEKKELEKKLEKLSNDYSKLLTYLKLSEDDIKKAVNAGRISDYFTQASSMLSRYT